MAIIVTHTGYIKRTLDHQLPRPAARRPGRMGMKTSDEDFVSHLFVASTHAYILFFTNRGRVYWLKVHEIPDVGPAGQGQGDRQPGSLQSGEKIAAVCAVRDFASGGFVLLATRKGMVKKTELAAFSNPRPSGSSPCRWRSGIISSSQCSRRPRTRCSSAPRDGMAIRFSERTCDPWAAPHTGSRG